MKSNIKFFKKSNTIPVDEFLNNVLYDNRLGYYSSRLPFGKEGDFITSPKISNLFSEIIAIWIISSWELFGKPKNFNIIELGPGDGSLIKILLKSFKKFPEFNSIKKVFLYEKSNYLKMIQKKNISNKGVRWIDDLDCIKQGPVIFFGNEFFDALPIKQFIKKKKLWYERYVNFGNLEKSYFYDVLFNMKKFEKKVRLNISKNQNFIEFSPLAINYLRKITKKIENFNGGILRPFCIEKY